MRPSRAQYLRQLDVHNATFDAPHTTAELSKFRGVFDPHEPRMSDDVNLGYEFARAYWSQGFAAEAVRFALQAEGCPVI